MVNIDPPEGLPDHWNTDFRSYYLECIQKRYDEYNEGTHLDALEDNIRRQKEHRKLVNLCVFPFNNKPSPAEFKFVRADPLAELDEELEGVDESVSNFDFMLWDFDGHAIFGEAKASTSQGAESLLNDVQEQIDLVNEYMDDYIVGNYIGVEPDTTEYVIATYAGDAGDMTLAAIRGGFEIITWSVHQMEKNISVNTELPAEADMPDDEDNDDVRERILHSKQALNNALGRADTRDGSFNVFPESHPVSKLRALTTAKLKEDGFCFVNLDDLVNIIDDEMFYLDRPECREVAEDIIDLGKRIDFLTNYEDHPSDYKIKSRYTNDKGLSETLKRKWKQYRVEQKIAGYQEYCYRLAAEKMDEQTQLGDFA